MECEYFIEGCFEGALSNIHVDYIVWRVYFYAPCAFG